MDRMKSSKSGPSSFGPSNGFRASTSSFHVASPQTHPSCGFSRKTKSRRWVRRYRTRFLRLQRTGDLIRNSRLQEMQAMAATYEQKFSTEIVGEIRNALSH